MTTDITTVEGQTELTEVFRHLAPLLEKSPLTGDAEQDPDMQPEVLAVEGVIEWVQMVEQAKDTFLDQCVEAHVRTREGHWPYVQWDPQSSKMTVVEKPAMKNEEEFGHPGPKHSVSGCAHGIPGPAQPELPTRPDPCGSTMEDAGELASRGCLYQVLNSMIGLNA